MHSNCLERHLKWAVRALTQVNRSLGRDGKLSSFVLFSFSIWQDSLAGLLNGTGIVHVRNRATYIFAFEGNGIIISNRENGLFLFLTLFTAVPSQSRTAATGPCLVVTGYPRLALTPEGTRRTVWPRQAGCAAARRRICPCYHKIFTHSLPWTC